MHLVPHPARNFEQLVAELLQNLEGGEIQIGFEFAGQNGERFEVDLAFGPASNRGIAEVKHYRYLSPPRVDLFMRALRQAKTKKLLMKAKRGLLVISCPLTPELEDAAKAFSDIEVWDSARIFSLASRFPPLLNKFEQLFEVSSTAAALSTFQPGADNLTIELQQRKGESLAHKLRAVAPGREQSRDFEDACIAALKYLFEADLHGWHEQHETDDNLHRRDLVCRILPSSEVWRLMLSDLKSRYVVFEFKNYSAPITQSEIMTTEKYLYPSALRKVAIIISPHGSSRTASMVIQGAMREHGKLILSLTVEEVASLLVEKDNGADPNTFLFDTVDRFLMGLGR